MGCPFLLYGGLYFCIIAGITVNIPPWRVHHRSTSIVGSSSGRRRWSNVSRSNTPCPPGTAPTDEPSPPSPCKTAAERTRDSQFLPLYADDTHVYRSVCVSYVSKAQAGSQCVNDVLSEVRVIRVPHQTDGDDLRTVKEDTGHPELLTALTLRKRRTNI